MRYFAACMCSLAFVALATADAPTDALAPYLDAQTLAVVHVDVSRVAVDPLIDSLNQLGKVDEHATAHLRQEAKRWTEDFTKAGGKDVYAIVSLPDLPQAPFYIIPLTATANADELTRLLQGRKAPLANSQPEVVEKLGDSLFAGPRATLARLRAAQPQPRPDVAKAFAAAGDGTLQVVLVPTADARRVVNELLPTLPREVGGGPITVLTQGVQWATAAADAPPQASLRIIIQSQDAAAALALRGLIGKGYELFGRAAQVPLPPLPEVQGDRLTLSLDAGTANAGPFLAQLAEAATASATRNQCLNNLKQIVLALHNYHDAKNGFPAVANFDQSGKPLLSWRVHILPYVGQEALYKEFHLDEPWDSEHNKKLIERMPDVYRCPSLRWGMTGKTAYLAPVGKNLMFTGDSHGVQIREVADGTSNTIFVVDAADDRAVIWTQPEDLHVNPAKPFDGLIGHHGAGFTCGFADGSSHYVSQAVDAKMLYALFTRNGGEVVSLP